MKRLLLPILFAVFLFYQGGGAYCVAQQNKKVDSLLALIASDNADTNKVKHLNEAGSLLMYQQPDTAVVLGMQALDVLAKLELDKQNNSKKNNLYAQTYSNLGVYYSIKSDYSIAIDYYLKGLKLSEDAGDMKLLYRLYNNIGIVFQEQGDYAKCLDYYSKSLRIAVDLDFSEGIAREYGNMGIVCALQNNSKQALEHYFKSMKMNEMLGNQTGIGVTLNNVVRVYLRQDSLEKAFEYGNKALSLNKKNNNKIEIANSVLWLGVYYNRKKEFNASFKNLFDALHLAESVGSKKTIMECYGSLATLYKESTISLLDTVNGKLLSLEQMRLKSLHYYKRMYAIKNNVFSDENKSAFVKSEINFDQDKKDAIKKAEHEMLVSIAEAKKKRVTVISITAIGGLIVVIMFSIFILKLFRTTRKQKTVIEVKNIEVELQKKEIEEKNKDITDSINYAKRIQRALLREEEHVSKHLPEHFILFMPKDIVSGDFYWGYEKLDYWYFAVADCTGHGVPGAIMSMLGISFLNDILSTEAILSPAEILDRLRDRVIEELRQKNETIGNKDGMDISLVRVNLKTLEVEWAGANNPLNYIQNNELLEIKADKQPIGYYPYSRIFTNHQLQLKKGDVVYIYSDGYADQFNEDDKKMTKKRFKEELLKVSSFPLNEQKNKLSEFFINWKGQAEQIDDVCVMGVKL